MMNELEDLFGTSFGLFLKAVEIVIGTSIFAITKGEDQFTFGENLTFFGYIAVLTFDNLMPSYLGNEIYSTSEEFLYDLYSSEWIDADLKYKKMMIIFMENLKNPVGLNVMWYKNLNLERFMEVSRRGF